jgi:hypothetical protein
MDKQKGVFTDNSEVPVPVARESDMAIDEQKWCLLVPEARAVAAEQERDRARENWESASAERAEWATMRASAEQRVAELEREVEQERQRRKFGEEHGLPAQLRECEEALRSMGLEYETFRERMLSPIKGVEGKSIESLSWDDLLGVAVRNLNHCLTAEAERDALKERHLMEKSAVVSALDEVLEREKVLREALEGISRACGFQGEGSKLTSRSIREAVGEIARAALAASVSKEEPA